MKMKSVISTILLAVYTIVLGHSVVPHHHHSENSGSPDFYCEMDEHQHSVGCCQFSLTAHNHNTHQHQPCNFNEKTILTKSVYMSVFFLPCSLTEIEFSNKEEKVFYTTSNVKIKSDPNSRHILLRGPPLFS
jgi:Ca2+/H+ antiporter